jgi:hypothetical protein
MSNKTGVMVSLSAVLMMLAGNALADKTHMVSGTVVSVDTAGNKLTLQTADGKTSTAPVEGDAIKALGTLQPGQAISVKCRDNDMGQHQSVTAIEVSKT